MSGPEAKSKVLPEGNYLAKIIGGAMQTDEKGTQIGVQFQLKDRTERLWWYGALSGERADYVFTNGKSAKQVVFENLARLGLDEQKVMSHPDAQETFRFDSGYFVDPSKEFELNVEHYTGKDSKVRVQVKYINEVGGGKFGKIAPKVVKAELVSLGFAAEMAAARLELGMLPLAADKATQPASFDSNEEIPF